MDFCDKLEYLIIANQSLQNQQYPTLASCSARKWKKTGREEREREKAGKEGR